MEWWLSIEWSETREWLVAFAGLVAVVIALRTYRHSVNVREREQARLVYAKVASVTSHYEGEVVEVANDGVYFEAVPQRWWGEMHDGHGNHQAVLQFDAHVVRVVVEVHNGSDELVGPGRVILYTSRPLLDNTSRVAVIEPGETKRLGFYMSVEAPGSQPGVRPILSFRDASGRWWVREGSDPIRPIPTDPENGGPTAVERRGIRDYQEKVGVPEELRYAEPRVRGRALLRRWWRRYVRRNPLPWETR